VVAVEAVVLAAAEAVPVVAEAVPVVAEAVLAVAEAVLAVAEAVLAVAEAVLAVAEAVLAMAEAVLAVAAAVVVVVPAAVVAAAMEGDWATMVPTRQQSGTAVARVRPVAAGLDSATRASGIQRTTLCQREAPIRKKIRTMPELAAEAFPAAAAPRTL
jgi:hypothetical protein